MKLKCCLSNSKDGDMVISRITGLVFSKRVIFEHLEKSEKCPITGIKMEKSDLLNIKVSDSENSIKNTLN